MPSHNVTSDVEQDLSRRVQELESELNEARQQQVATSQILGVISRSQTDVHQVFNTIIASALKLCSARQGAVYLYDGTLVHLGAHQNYPLEVLGVLRGMFPRPPQQDTVSGRAILNRAIAQMEDARWLIRCTQGKSPRLAVGEVNWRCR